MFVAYSTQKSPYLTGTVEAKAQSGQSAEQHRVLVALDCIERLDVREDLGPCVMQLQQTPQVDHIEWILLVLAGRGSREHCSVRSTIEIAAILKGR